MDDVIDLGATDGSDIEIISENITRQWRRRKIKQKVTDGGRTKIHVKSVNNPMKDNQESYIKEEIIISDASDCSENEDSKDFNTKTCRTNGFNSNKTVSKKKQNPNDSLSSIILNCPRCNKTETVFSTTIKCICKECNVNMYYVCEKCNFRYESMSALYRHKKFQCGNTGTKELSPLKLFIRKCSKCNASRKVIHVHKDKKCLKCKQEMMYECVICSKPYNSYSGLYQHWKLQCQPKQKIYYCDKCNFKCTCETIILRHISRHHSELFPLTESCSKCFKSFSAETLKIHESICGLAFYNCKFCVYKPKFEERLRKHLLTKHKEFVPNEKELKKLMQEAINKRKISVDETKITKETSAHNKEKNDLKALRAAYCASCDRRVIGYGISTNCPICRGAFQYECVRCNKRFTARQSLYRHITRLHGTQSYRCHGCQRRFSFYGDANEHRKICGKAPGFECEICFFKTRYKHNLITHMAKLHNGNRPLYSCPYCAVEYKTLGPLEKHVRGAHPKMMKVAAEELKGK